jgi:hypothetical protein
MTADPDPSPPVSRTYLEDGQRLLRVSPTHAISEDWLLVHTPTLYAAWHAAASEDRDPIAALIDERFDSINDAYPQLTRLSTDIGAEPHGRRPAAIVALFEQRSRS